LRTGSAPDLDLVVGLDGRARSRHRVRGRPDPDAVRERLERAALELLLLAQLHELAAGEMVGDQFPRGDRLAADQYVVDREPRLALAEATGADPVDLDLERHRLLGDRDDAERMR
jgi:hypothetical protein